jgi:hypothetical protein
MGNGDGTFESSDSYPAGAYPTSVAVSDVNADNRPDLVVANDAGVSILLCNEDGSFAQPVDFPAGFNSLAVETGDFNGDGQPDVAVANYNLEGTVTVLVNECEPTDVTLTIARINETVTISWPFPSTGFILESTMDLNPPDWKTAPEEPTNNNGRWTVDAANDQLSRYFRLRKP